MQKKFSYPIKIDELNQNQYHFEIIADKEEREDIKQILQVEDVRGLRGDIYLKYDKKNNLLRVWGSVSAVLILQSVISLENFKQKIKTPFELFFDTKATYKDIHDMENSINDEVPDIIEKGEINLADICIEQIALQLDDYPRAEGEEFYYETPDVHSYKGKENPFAILQKLKK